MAYSIDQCHFSELNLNLAVKNEFVTHVRK